MPKAVAAPFASEPLNVIRGPKRGPMIELRADQLRELALRIIRHCDEWEPRFKRITDRAERAIARSYIRHSRALCRRLLDDFGLGPHCTDAFALGALFQNWRDRDEVGLWSGGEFKAFKRGADIARAIVSMTRVVVDRKR